VGGSPGPSGLYYLEVLDELEEEELDGLDPVVPCNISLVPPSAPSLFAAFCFSFFFCFWRHFFFWLAV